MVDVVLGEVTPALVVAADVAAMTGGATGMASVLTGGGCGGATATGAPARGGDAVLAAANEDAASSDASAEVFSKRTRLNVSHPGS